MSRPRATRCARLPTYRWSDGSNTNRNSELEHRAGALVAVREACNTEP